MRFNIELTWSKIMAFVVTGCAVYIDAGTDVGLSYEGTAPDMGPFESNYSINWIAFIVVTLVFINRRNRRRFRNEI